MEINLNTPALLFPAVSLLMLAYTNRFLALAALIRQLHETYQARHEAIILKQISHLRWRLILTRNMQACGVLSLLFCVLSMFLIYQKMAQYGAYVFGASLVTMMASLVLSLWEIQISVLALNWHLTDLQKRHDTRR